MSASTTKRKQVHFLPENDLVYEIKCIDDFTKQEIQDYWYTNSQLEKVAMQRTTAALRWESGAMASTYFDIRGLEQYTQEWGKRTERNIERCITAVMDEQDAEWSTGGDTCDLLAAVSHEASRVCAKQALARAQEDRLAALRIYKERKQLITKSKKAQDKIRNVFRPSTIRRIL